MQQAMVAAEDSRFYQHNGVDYKGIARAMVANNSAGGVQQGASTLTMQYVRGALPYSATSPQEVVAPPRTPRSASSARCGYAMAVEKELTKDADPRALPQQAYFGHGAYGDLRRQPRSTSPSSPTDLNARRSRPRWPGW